MYRCLPDCRPADRFAVSLVDRPNDGGPALGRRSLSDDFEIHDDITGVVGFEFEHAQLIGHELEGDFVSRQLDVVPV